MNNRGKTRNIRVESNKYGISNLLTQRSGRDSDPSPPSSAVVKKE